MARLNTFQKMLKGQILRFGVWLIVIFSLLFMAVLLVYSLLYSSYRAGKYNELLVMEFQEVYQVYSDYLGASAASGGQFLQCLDGKISGGSLAFIFNSFSRSNKVSSHMILTGQRGEIVSTTYRDVTVSQITFNQKVLENAASQDGLYNTVYFFEGLPRYVFAKTLKDENGDFLGAVCFYVNMNELADRMYSLHYSGIIVQDDSDVIVASDRSMIKTLNHFDGVANGRFENNGQTYWMCSSRLPAYDVTVYTYVSVVQIAGYYFICCLFMLVILLSIWVFFSRFAQRIAQHSASSVEQFHQEIDAVTRSALAGDESLRLCLRTGDEFEDIAQHINSMLESMSELSGRNMALLRLNTAMEMRTLEAQFNPHFLYNTLENIRFAIQMGIEGTGDIILKLTKLLRYSIDSSKAEVTFAEDLVYLEGYLEIIQFRFGNRFTYRIDVSPSCASWLIPKLMLQPILENSAKYGFQTRESVHVVITGYVKDGFCWLTVTDDGMGMTQPKLAEVRGLIGNPSDPRDPKDHRELQNTARRLQLQYGKGSRLEIDSIYGSGTTVTLCIGERRQ